MRGLLQPKDQTCLLPSPGSAALFAFLLLPLSFNPGLQKLSLPQPWGDGGGALPWTTPSPLSFPPQTMVVALGLLLALLGCSAALDLALEEAWEGWKSLYAKEYTKVGPCRASSSAPQASEHVPGPAPEGSAPNVSPLVLPGGLFLTPGCSAPRQEAEAVRREVWEKNLRRIEQHNREEARGQHAFRLAMNHYGDMVVELGTSSGSPSRHPGLEPGSGDTLGVLVSPVLGRFSGCSPAHTRVQPADGRGVQPAPERLRPGAAGGAPAALPGIASSEDAGRSGLEGQGLRDACEEPGGHGGAAEIGGCILQSARNPLGNPEHGVPLRQLFG